MATKLFQQAHSETGITAYVVIERDTDGYFWDNTTNTFVASVTGVQSYVAMTEHSTIKGLYEFSETTAFNNGLYSFYVYKQAGGTAAPASDTQIGAGTMWIASDAEVVVASSSNLDSVISELGVEAPAATPSTRDALMLLYMALRNQTKTQTSGVDALEIYNDAGTIICKKLLTDDGSDYTEAKMTSG